MFHFFQVYIDFLGALSLFITTTAILLSASPFRRLVVSQILILFSSSYFSLPNMQRQVANMKNWLIEQVFFFFVISVYCPLSFCLVNFYVFQFQTNAMLCLERSMDPYHPFTAGCEWSSDPILLSDSGLCRTQILFGIKQTQASVNLIKWALHESHIFPARTRPADIPDKNPAQTPNMYTNLKLSMKLAISSSRTQNSWLWTFDLEHNAFCANPDPACLEIWTCIRIRTRPNQTQIRADIPTNASSFLSAYRKIKRNLCHFLIEKWIFVFKF